MSKSSSKSTKKTPSTKSPASSADSGKLDETRTYKKRWAILAMFCAVRTSTTFQWYEYTIIIDTVEKYYGLDGTSAIVWTASVFMLTYILWVIPATWALEKYGLRFSVLMGSSLNCFGSWIKCASADPGRFWVTFLGQTIVGTSQSFTMALPAKLAAIWFGPKEVATACSLGVFGAQLGIALGFLLPSTIVQDIEELQSNVSQESSTNSTNNTQLDYDTVTRDLLELFIGSAVVNTIVLVIIAIFFADKSKAPPSLAQLSSLREKRRIKRTYWQSLKELCRNRNFMLLFFSFGIIAGSFHTVSTLLKRVVRKYHPKEKEHIGHIGLVMVFSGIAGSLLCGFWLDKTKRYRLTVTLVYLLSLVGMVLYTFLIDVNGIVLVFVLGSFLGFFMTGYYPLGIEYGVELTYPISEGTSSGLLTASAQAFGLVMTQVMSQILNNFSVLTCNLCISSCLLVGLIITLLTKGEMRRDTTERSLKEERKKKVEKLKPITLMAKSCRAES